MMKLFGLLFLMSCAHSTHYIKKSEMLPYQESAQVTKLLRKSKPLKLISVKDQRDKKEIGKAYTGVHYSETVLALDTDFKTTMQNYLVDSLETRNIVISNDADLEFEIEIGEVWVEEVIEKFQGEKAKCRVSMNFHVTGPGEKWSGSFWTEFLSGGDLSDGTARLAPTLASCLNDIVEKLINDKKFKDIIK